MGKYCSENKQTAITADNAVYRAITAAFATITANNAITQAQATAILSCFQRIHDIGNYGTLNPTSAIMKQLTDWIGKDKTISATHYNVMVNILRSGSGNSALVSSDFVSSNIELDDSKWIGLKNALLNYKLNADRCDSCNNGLTCSTGCQVTCQGCYTCQCSGQQNQGGGCGHCEDVCEVCQTPSQTSCGSCQDNCQDCQTAAQTCSSCYGGQGCDSCQDNCQDCQTAAQTCSRCYTRQTGGR